MAFIINNLAPSTQIDNSKGSVIFINNKVLKQSSKVVEEIPDENFEDVSNPRIEH